MAASICARPDAEKPAAAGEGAALKSCAAVAAVAPRRVRMSVPKDAIFMRVPFARAALRIRGPRPRAYLKQVLSFRQAAARPGGVPRGSPRRCYDTAQSNGGAGETGVVIRSAWC